MKSVAKKLAVVSVACLAFGVLVPNLHAHPSKDIVDTAVGAGSFNTLVAAVKAAGLVDALKGKGPLTVFAPTDEAFAKLPSGTVETLLKPENKDKLIAVLTYHVVSGNVPAKTVVGLKGAVTLNGQRVDIKVDGGKVQVDNANVIKTDIACSNGTIHVIDSVILPASDNIPATAVKAGDFETLVAAVKAAGLAEALSGKGPFTVFAPTDAAFAKLPKGTVETLLKPENKSQLVAILKYHVVAGRVYSEAAVKAKSAKTLQGQSIRVNIADGKARINDSNLVATDIDASNGVIHVIDAVLLPPKKDAVSQAEARSMIEHAIHRGVRMFNSGHHDSCAKVYAETAGQMISYGEQMPPIVMTSLRSAMNEASHTQCPTAKSWALRRGLDKAYYALSSHSR